MPRWPKEVADAVLCGIRFGLPLGSRSNGVTGMVIARLDNGSEPRRRSLSRRAVSGSVRSMRSAACRVSASNEQSSCSARTMQLVPIPLFDHSANAL